MKKISCFLILIITCYSCVENQVDSQQDMRRKTLSSYVTKSVSSLSVDSLRMREILQRDVDNLMMHHVVFQDSCFVLTLTLEDIASLNISREIYMKYIEYVDRLNREFL